jgi:hypothetical protein
MKIIEKNYHRRDAKSAERRKQIKTLYNTEIKTEGAEEITNKIVRSN